MRIMDQWLGYRNDVIPMDAPKAQLRESKRAFFAGAMALFTEIAQPPSITDQEIVSLMHELSAELRSFNEKVRRGEE